MAGLAAGALVALAAWPALQATHARATAERTYPGPTAAPVKPDYLYRNAIIGDFERDVQRHPDQLVTRMLAAQYLQRYRETVDVGDLLRAVAATNESLRIQPRFNVAAESTMASDDTALHRFREAKRYADDVVRLSPWSSEASAADAGLALELGEYAQAQGILASSPGSRDDGAFEIATARYDELTGRLSAARALNDRVMTQADTIYDNPAEGRSWYHWRAGELAFEAGDVSAAEADYKEALMIFPHSWHAYNGLAKLYWAQRRWREAIDAATKAAAIYPQPETLGYEYDAQLALGKSADAAATRDLIFAVERIGNAQGLSDRLIALFEADHQMRPDDAVSIARRDLARRDDIYAEDTLAWALASAGRWKEARLYSDRALRLGTQDARLRFHAGVIAWHCDDAARAKQLLTDAIDWNPHFHPWQPDQARQIVASF
jgi:tetratricopeptide (TPR) repeat protein